MNQITFPIKTCFGSIRPARPGDTNAILDLIAKLALHHEDTATVKVSDPQWVHVLVAETDNNLVGYAALCNMAQLQFGARGMDIHHLFVERDWRGQGVGAALINACTGQARGLFCTYLTVGTHPENHKAQAFYEAMGFERRDTHPPRFLLRLDGA